MGIKKTKQTPNFSLGNAEMGNRNRAHFAWGGLNSEVQLLKPLPGYTSF